MQLGATPTNASGALTHTVGAITRTAASTCVKNRSRHANRLTCLVTGGLHQTAGSGCMGRRPPAKSGE
jgi:hypothetical protein